VSDLVIDFIKENGCFLNSVDCAPDGLALVFFKTLFVL